MWSYRVRIHVWERRTASCWPPIFVHEQDSTNFEWAIRSSWVHRHDNTNVQFYISNNYPLLYAKIHMVFHVWRGKAFWKLNQELLCLQKETFSTMSISLWRVIIVVWIISEVGFDYGTCQVRSEQCISWSWRIQTRNIICWGCFETFLLRCDYFSSLAGRSRIDCLRMSVCKKMYETYRNRKNVMLFYLFLNIQTSGVFPRDRNETWTQKELWFPDCVGRTGVSVSLLFPCRCILIVIPGCNMDICFSKFYSVGDLIRIW